MEPSPLLDTLARTLVQRCGLRLGARLLVAVSGGLDSMVLLEALHRLAAPHRWQLAVAHFNHQLRGRASKADERLVVDTAARLGWPCLTERGAVRACQVDHSLSLEMAARQLRHEFLARAARQFGANTIALAHHADDQVELFFLRLLRGAGSEGLAGMAWQSVSPVDAALRLIRPLLDQTKAALGEFARRHGVVWREDASNLELEALRNRVRHRLLPYLERHYQPAVRRVVWRAMETLGAEHDYLAGQARRWLARRRPPAFERWPVALQRQGLRQQLLELGITPDFRLIEQLRECSGQAVMVTPGLTVLRHAQGRLRTERIQACPQSRAKRQLDLQRDSGRARFGSLQITWRMIARPPLGQVTRPHSRPFELFDADRINSPIILRHWQPGDRFQPLGGARSVKLQDWFTNQKVPRRQRHRLVIAARSDGQIFWIEGQRIASLARVRATTRRCLEWRWRRSASD